MAVSCQSIDLSLPGLDSSKPGIPSTLSLLLYRGGASLHVGRPKEYEAWRRGRAILARLPFLTRLHDVFEARVAAGEALLTTKGCLRTVRVFYRWAELRSIALTHDRIEIAYTAWCDSLLVDVRSGKITLRTACDAATQAGGIFAMALRRENSLYRSTQLHSVASRERSAPLSKATQLPSDAEVHQFISVMRDICNSLDVSTMFQPLPVILRFDGGLTFEHWSGLTPRIRLRMLDADPYHRDLWLKSRVASENDISLSRRYPLFNLRLYAELLIFISQTGINLNQALSLNRGNYNFRKYLDGYRVSRIYKNRRHGQVEFYIYSEYRTYFEKYLKWLSNTSFQISDKRLFPFFFPRHTPPIHIPTFISIKDICKHVGASFIPARLLRKIRLNWLFEKTNNSILTAEIGQHSVDTLHRHYISINTEKVSREICLFHRTIEPNIRAAGPGICSNLHQPQKLVVSPVFAPDPDCVSPSGCLFCQHQRDIDSQDHVWCLATLRHLKSIELAANSLQLPDPRTHPAAAVIDILSHKLDHFRSLGSRRALWVQEALDRVEEGRFHPMWDGFIRFAEISL